MNFYILRINLIIRLFYFAKYHSSQIIESFGQNSPLKQLIASGFTHRHMTWKDFWRKMGPGALLLILLLWPCRQKSHRGAIEEVRKWTIKISSTFQMIFLTGNRKYNFFYLIKQMNPQIELLGSCIWTWALSKWTWQYICFNLQEINNWIIDLIRPPTDTYHEVDPWNKGVVGPSFIAKAFRSVKQY